MSFEVQEKSLENAIAEFHAQTGAMKQAMVAGDEAEIVRIDRNLSKAFSEVLSNEPLCAENVKQKIEFLLTVHTQRSEMCADDELLKMVRELVDRWIG